MKKEIIKSGRLQVDKEEGWSWRERNSHQRVLRNKNSRESPMNQLHCQRKIN